MTAPLDKLRGLRAFELGALAGVPLSAAQLVALKCIEGNPLNRAERRTLRALTGVGIFERPRTDGYREVLVRAGRRSGKTTRVAAPLAVAAALRSVDQLLAPGEVARVLCIAPRRDLAAILLDAVGGLLDALGVRFERLSYSLRIPGVRVIIEVSTADVVSARGSTAVAAIVDEAALLPTNRDAAGSIGEVLAAVRPTLATTNGRLVLLSTPWGKEGFFHERVEALRGTLDGPGLALVGPTWLWHPALSEQATRELEPDEKVWRREYAAEPSDAESSALDRDDIQACVRGDIPVLPERVAIGFDASGGKHDAHALVGAGRVLYRSHGSMPIEDLVVVPADLVRHWPPSKLLAWRLHDRVADEAARLARQWHAMIALDNFGGDAWVAAFRSRGVRVKVVSMAPAVQAARFKLLGDLIASRRLVLPNHPELIRQLCQLRERVMSGGRVVYSAPHRRDAHDDLVDALGVACERAMRLAPSGGNIEQRMRVMRNGDGRPCGFETTYWAGGMPVAPPSGTRLADDLREQRRAAGIVDLTNADDVGELERREQAEREAYASRLNVRVINNG